MAFQKRLLESLGKYSGNTAIEYGGLRISYSEFLTQSSKISCFLLKNQLPPETVVGIFLDDRIDIVRSIVGVINARCVFVPLDSALPDQRLATIINHLALRHVIVSRQSRQNNRSLEWSGLQVYFIEDMLSGGDEDFELPRYEGDDSAYVYFTSGSTGVPKGIVGRNASLLQFVDWEINAFGIESGWRFSQFTSPYFDAFLRDIFVPLMSGGTICIPTDEIIVPWIEASGINLIHCVPSLFRVIINGSLSPDTYKHLRYVLMSGEKIIPTELSEWFASFGSRVRLVNLYGATETTMIRSFYEILPEDVNQIRIPIGSPIADTELLILDKDMKPCNKLVPGDLYIVSEYVTKGYLNSPELTHSKFVKLQIGTGPGRTGFRTGDKARVLPNGKIDLLGREDRQVKIRGVRIELDEIETTLMQSGILKSSLVVKSDGEGGDEGLIAYVVGKEDPQDVAWKESLLRFLEDRLPKYMIPSAIVRVAEFPLLPNGKIDYRKLQLKIVEEKKVIAPENELEAGLLSIWKDIVRNPTISTDENFSKVGGNSLNMMTLISRISKEYDVKLSLRQLFENLTIKKQATFIKNTIREARTIIPSSPVKEYYSLSGAQRRLYFLYEYDRTSLAYNMPQVVKLEGELEKARLKRSFRDLIARHESLRTSFHMINGKPVQTIAENVDFELEQFVASEVEAQNTIRRFIRPFDLSKPSLIRVGIIEITPVVHILMVDTHHIISDGVSESILIRDFVRLYRNDILPALKITYKDFAEWEQTDEQQSKISTSREFWVSEFSDEQKPLQLPTDFSRPSVKRDEGHAITFDLTPDESKKLKDLAEAHGATIFMVVLSAYYALMSRLSAQNDVVIGVSIAGRQHPDLDNIMGMFVNTMPIRIQSDPGKNFAELFSLVKSKTVACIENQHYPYEELIDSLSLKRDTSRNPMFDVLLAYQNFELVELEIPGITLKPFQRAQTVCKFDITLFVSERNDRIVFNLEYATSLFLEDTIQRFVGYFKTILYSIISSTQLPVGKINLVSEKEERQQLHFEQNLKDAAAILKYPGIEALTVCNSNSLIPGLRPRIVTEALHRLPIGVAGQLCICVPGNSATDVSGFVPDPLLKDDFLFLTGTKARWLNDGRIEILEKLPAKLVSNVQDISDNESQAQTGGQSSTAIEIENKLLDIWADVLKLDRSNIDLKTRFTELGGNSLRVLLMINKVYKELNVNVPLKSLFENNTIKLLGDFVQKARKNDYLSIKPSEKKDHYPLTDAQKPLFFLHQFDQGSTVYNQPRVLKIDGKVDVEKLRAAFKKIVHRHEVLRTSFKVVDDEPVQVVDNNVSFDIEYFTLSEADARALIESSFRPFDLEQAPLMRVILIKVTSETYYLMVDIHHIILDGTSDVILMNELATLYAGYELPELKIQYKDYAEWTQSPDKRTEDERKKAFWIGQLEEREVLELPADYVDPVPDGYMGGATDLIIGSEDVRALRAIAQSEGASMFTTILATFNILLSKLSGQEDILVGTFVSGRQHADVEQAVGMFVMDLPLRNTPHGDMAFTQFLSQVKSNTLSCLENQSYQYKAALPFQAGRSDINQNPLYNALLLFPNFEKGKEIELPGIKIERYDLGGSVELRYDITLIVQEDGEKLKVRLCCNRFFKKETRERFAMYFEEIVKGVARTPLRKISDISILTVEEKDRIMKVFNNTGKFIDRKKCFFDLFREQAERTPDQIAVQHNKEELTYHELYRRSSRLSAHLFSAGLAANSKVALFMPRGTEMLTSILGIFRAGCSYVPIDIDYPKQRIEDILHDSECSIILTTDEFVGEVTEAVQATGSVLTAITTDTLDKGVDFPEYEIQYSSDDLAYVIYTSGTTGKPKGVMVHQLGMINHIYAKINDLNLTGKDIIAQTASPCFDISVWQFLAALVVGGKTYIIDKERLLEPVRLLSVLRRAGITIFESVPSLMSSFLYGLSKEDYNSLPDLRWMIPTGERLGVGLVKKWYACFSDLKLLNAYGPTEASDDVTHYPVPLPAEGQAAIPIGKPIQNMQIYVLDRYMNLCPIGVKGEICVAGLGVSKGYWKNFAKNQRAFISNPLASDIRDSTDYLKIFRTGDIGYFLENGDIICLGRTDEQVKIRGFRIEPSEIENVLIEYEQVKDAVVLAYSNADGGKRLAAFVVLVEPSDPMPEFRILLKGRLPEYMVPSEIIKVDRLPLTKNGKVDKPTLLKRLAVLNHSKDNYVQPQTETEWALAHIWQELLGIEKVGAKDDFFEIGGHSLLAMKLASTIKRKLEIEIPIRVIFQLATITSIAQWLELNRISNVAMSENSETIVI